MKETPSTIRRLPDQIRDEIGRLREAGRTLDEILEHLQGMHGLNISRSALGRYTKKQAKMREAITRSHVLAEAIGRNFADGKTSKVAQANVDLLHSMLMKFMVVTEGDDGDDETNTLDAKDFMMLATAVDKLAKASKTDLEHRLKEAVEKERRETTAQAATAAADAAKRRGLSKETVEDIKSAVLGIEKQT
jgi:hypothetical protein